MKREGGSNPKDHVRRVLNRLLPVDLQKQLNRTGGYGKVKLPSALENRVKGNIFIQVLFKYNALLIIFHFAKLQNCDYTVNIHLYEYIFQKIIRTWLP